MESRLLDLIDELYSENAQTDRTTTGGGCQAKASPRGTRVEAMSRWGCLSTAESSCVSRELI